MIRTLVLIGIGGGAGSILRYLTGLGISKYISSPFPWGTFAVNLIGSFLAGFILSTFTGDNHASHDWRLFLMTGFCGGYTTFSAFTAENFLLFQTGQATTALLYVFSSILLGLLGVWLGFLCGS